VLGLLYPNARFFHRLSANGIEGLLVLYSAGDCFHHSLAATEVQERDTWLADDESKPPLGIVGKYTGRRSMIEYCTLG
jgi:hypothetical protein